MARFSSRNTGENWQRSEKTKGLGGQNTHNKLSSQSISLFLAYNMQPRLIYLTHPPLPPSLRTVSTAVEVHILPRPQPQTVSNSKRQGGKWSTRLERKLFVQPNQVYPKQPYPIYLLPNICSVGAPVCKVAP